MLDIRIMGGMVIDGTGTEPRQTDIGVTGDTITMVGNLSQVQARLTLDLAGNVPAGASLSRKVVCPGFIDVHSHSDTKILIEPSATSKIYQGVTTEIVGNCGSSAAPIAGPMKAPWEKDDGEGLPGQWHSVAEYRQLLEAVKPAVNVAMLIGHGTLRAGVMGYGDRVATDEDLKCMVRSLEQALDEGGRGLSSGLIYPPGMFASVSELVELARVVGRRGGLYATHMRNEGSGLLDSLRETLDLGRQAGVRVEISHLKTRGRENWPLVGPALELIRSRRAEGDVVQADRYPYIAANTSLDTVLPPWVHDGGSEAALVRLRDRTIRERIVRELREERPAFYWDTVTIASTVHLETKPFQGRPLAEIAEILGLDPVETVLHLLDLDELKTTAFFFGMSEENMLRILAEPWVTIGSDASLRAPTGLLSRDFPHPRAYGTFARFLRMSLNGRTVDLPEAVRKMTSLPAEHFGLRDRGRIAVGLKADIVVFDPANVCDRATYANPHQLAQGVEYVIVNGVVTLKEGRLTGNRAGRFL
ncbi:MAG: D-aminoacylase [Kiritimatiellae bacterium]|nr:D-aminoacylase [Kiritimatiellia bacterium]